MHLGLNKYIVCMQGYEFNIHWNLEIFVWAFIPHIFLILIFIFKTWIFELIILTRSHGFLNFKCTMVQPEFSRLLRFFIPQKGTNQIQVFRILTNHHRVFLRNKINTVNEKTPVFWEILKFCQASKLNILFVKSV